MAESDGVVEGAGRKDKYGRKITNLHPDPQPDANGEPTGRPRHTHQLMGELQTVVTRGRNTRDAGAPPESAIDRGLRTIDQMGALVRDQCEGAFIESG